MSISNLTIQATERFRKVCLTKNLPPYNIQGQYTPNTASYNQSIFLSEFAVIDSPNSYITDPPFREQLYPLNNYGPNGGYNLDVRIGYPSTGQNVVPNQGEYNPTDTQLDLEYEAEIDLAYNENRYGPEGGFSAMYFVSNNGTNGRVHLPYWEPPTFIPSSYSPIQILSSNNPIGDSGFLSQDSALANIGAKRLKTLFEDRINLERINNITSFIDFNYKITTPESILSPTANFALRISDSYSPTSPIPGNYFDENEKKGVQTNQTSKALSTINTLTGGLLGPILNLKRNPSQIFLANTGNGQRSILFRNLNLNLYQPDYSKFSGGIRGLLTSLGRGVLNIFDNTENGYYVGSSKKEPGNLTSPRNQVPVDQFGRQVSAPVYGPTDLSLLYEGNETKLKFGLAGTPTSEGGGIDGQFVWTSPKYKNNAGFRATPGGGSGKKDQEFFQIQSQYQRDESTSIGFKKGSILDNTQRLVSSADKVSGAARLKHVGNAINQVSKVFNDGYKEMTRGSKVLSFIDNTTGREEGIEYARVFTKDAPYYNYNDLQKKDGITTSGRSFTNSVLDNTYNLNIAPLRGTDSTNIVPNERSIPSVKKYMFSIENLAWRTSSQPGLTWDDLPACERGPNGGRIMWFPPYDLKFSDTSSPSFNPTSFLGRPEPIYTYKETSRSGTLSWKIVVDHPSILNVVIRRQLKGVKKEKIDSILNSFFAGAMKYDIYELAKRFPTIPVSIQKQIQEAIQNTTNTDSAKKLVDDIPKDSSGNPNSATNNDTKLNELKKDFETLGFYFPKAFDFPNDYDKVYDYYKTQSKDQNIFDRIITPNYDKLKDSFFNQLKDFLTQNPDGLMNISMKSSVVNVGPNFQPLSSSAKQKVIIEKYFTEQAILKPFFDNKRIKLNFNSIGYNTNVSPSSGGGVPGESFNCSTIETNEAAPSATACRRVAIESISFTPQPKSAQQNTQENQQQNEEGKKPQDTETALEKLQKGISKKIIRNLLNEGDYFDMIKEDTPFIYDSLQENLKFFSPAFHSTTPEGLNARLTFLNQCVRPGETIPVIGVNGLPTQNNALNTSFGAPPILVLRIGDFYHTKIVPTSLSFSYDPLELDMNPEGIGVQPMIANVSMNFNIIGGMGLAKPVEELQNALSFNFYANTEIYDERATATEDTSKLDKELWEALSKAIPTPKNETQPQQNGGGNTIGNILNGTTSGEIDYNVIMTNLLSLTSEYFELVVNRLQSFQEKNNLGIVQILNYKRQYNFGSIQKSPFNPGNKETIEIYGKPFGWEESVDSLFSRVQSSIDDNTNPIISFLAKFFQVNDDSFPIRDVKKNMKEYISNISSEFKSPIATQVQELVNSQQSYIQNIRKLNVIVDKTDGKINDKGTPTIYNISGVPYNQLVDDFGKLKVAMDRYVDLLKSGNNPIAFYETNNEIQLVNTNKFGTEADVDFFVVMSRILTDKDKKQEFVDFVIKNELTSVTRPVKLLNKFEKIVDDLAKDYNDELKDENRLFDRLKKRQEYKNLTKGLSKIMYKPNIERKCGYNTTPDNSIEVQQKTLIQNLYSGVNVNEDTTTFDGKIVFN
jgi:hypothetical protein